MIRLSANHETKAYNKDRWAWNFLSQQGVRVPHVFEVGRLAGVIYALSLFCQGNSLREQDLQLVLPSLFEQLECLHRCTLPLDSIQQMKDTGKLDDWKSLVTHYSQAAIQKWQQIAGHTSSRYPIFEEIELKIKH